MKILLQTLILLIVGVSSASAKYIIEGTLNSNVPSSVQNQRLMLLEVLIVEGQERPQMTPKQRASSNEKGFYRFEIESINPKAFYQVGLFLKGQPIASDYIQFKNDQKKKVVNLQLPSISKDRSLLSVNKNVFYFEPLEEQVLITEVVHILNDSTNYLQIENALQKKLHQPIEDFKNLAEGSGVNIENTEKLLKYSVNIPPGDNQYFYQYKVSKNLWDSLELEFSLLPGTNFIELILPLNSLRLEDKNGNEVIFIEKQFGEQKFRSAIFGKEEFQQRFLEGDRLVTKVLGLPLNRNLTYFALIPFTLFVTLPFLRKFRKV